MDETQKTYFYNKQIESDRVDKILFKLDIAEAFNFAYVGSQPDKTHGSSNSYNEWRTKNVNDLYPESERPKQISFWDVKDNLKKKGKRSFKIM
jgi:hypothetical protein